MAAQWNKTVIVNKGTHEHAEVLGKVPVYNSSNSSSNINNNNKNSSITNHNHNSNNIKRKFK